MLSRTKRGSLLSAKTTFSLPTATPKGHFFCASAIVKSVATTQLLEISYLKGPVRFPAPLLLFSSCLRTLPTRAVRSFAGHCLLHGIGPKAPVGTPSCRKGSRARSGSPMTPRVGAAGADGKAVRWRDSNRKELGFGAMRTASANSIPAPGASEARAWLRLGAGGRRLPPVDMPVFPDTQLSEC